MEEGSRYDKLQARYNLLSSTFASGGSLRPDTGYAEFIKTHDFQTLPNVVPDPFPSHPPPQVGSKHPKPRSESPNAIRKMAESSLEESQKRLKAIEDHMWQHRQKDRDLKRAEMEIVKRKKHVQRVMKDYESSIAQKQSEGDKTLLDKEMDLVQYQQQELHLRNESGVERKRVVLAGRQRLNEITKKYIKEENQLTCRYQNMVHSLERKRAEVEQLSKDFEAKLRTKEEEQFKLKQELAKLAITLNMEAHKHRQTISKENSDKERTTRKQIQTTLAGEENMSKEETSKTLAGRRYEEQRRDLEHTLRTKQDDLSAKQRQGSRELDGVRTKLQRNAEDKQFTSQEAEHIQSEMLGQHSQNRVQLVENRKRLKCMEDDQKRRERNALKVSEWGSRFTMSQNEMRKREHEERLRKLSNMVLHYDSQEKEMFSQVRTVEAKRKKQSQVVDTLNKELEYLKQTNSKQLKEAAMQARKAESELHQKILRENADLTKTINTREECLGQLTSHRQRVSEDRRSLKEEKKEYNRRTRIENRTTLQTV